MDGGAVVAAALILVLPLTWIAASVFELRKELRLLNESLRKVHFELAAHNDLKRQ